MTPQQLATLHARCFAEGPRPWSVAEFSDFIASNLDTVLHTPNALAVVRVVAGEAELLTICVDPDAQGAGLGRTMLDRVMADAQQRGAESMFLEVAADNAAARALYHAAGFTLSGLRKGYYRRAIGPMDALVLMRDLPLRQG